MRKMKAASFCPSRLNTVAKLFAAISGKTFDESVDIILTTDTGRAIARNNPCALYEQATDNIWDIAGELKNRYPEIHEKFTPQKIVETYTRGTGIFSTERTRFPMEKRLKDVQRERLKKAWRICLRCLRQARIESMEANGFKNP